MLRQLLVQLLVDVVEDVPVVGNLGPGAHDERHLALVQALDGDHRRIIGLGQQRGQTRLVVLAQLLGMAALPVEQPLPPGQRFLLGHFGDFFLRLLSRYREGKLNESHTDNKVSARFHNCLKQHFREHRDVGFYAAQACLSTKHFSAIIKQETGHTAAYWIHQQVIVEAKMLLHMRHDLTVQAISDMLGFDEQATFSRYFRRETGLSPSEFRSTDNSGGDEKKRGCFVAKEK